jgi:hypothetical protein
MKPPHWNKFLEHIALDYQLQGRVKDLFLVRFAYENWRKPDREICELVEAPSHEMYKKQMTELYNYFSKDRPDGCPELESHSRGPGKFSILRDWLKDIKYPQWKPSTDILFDFPIPIDSSYIERPPVEITCYQEILQPGALIRIKAPEKMGKTSLLKMILKQAENYSYHQVYLNLRTAEGAMFNTLDKFLRWFCANISRELHLKPSLDDYWDEELFGSLVSCKSYFQGYLLENLDKPLVLCLDHVDRVFEFPTIAQDFFPMLRYWYEEAKNLDSWKKLRMVIANSTEAYIKLDANQSPFNVGRQIKLSGFDLAQVQQLAQGYGLDWKNQVNQGNFAINLLELVGGHPYLVRLAIEALLNENITTEQLLKEASTQGGIYGDHLRHYWNNLQQQPELINAIKKVVNSENGVNLEPSSAYKLESMGLVTILGDNVRPSCKLYAQYFQDNL